ncbi:MAG: hypothetical protein AAFZ15_23305 [Bacteroidota bacterium]
MSKIVLISIISFLFLSCQKQSPKEKSPTNSIQQTTKGDGQSKIGQTNFAVIWTWTTTKPDLVTYHLPTIADELSNLWKNDVIENAYFDAEAKDDKLGHFANVAFFLKAPSTTEARLILNELTVVKQGIATYTLHPVGLLWLDRKTDIINEKGMTKSYVAVWKTQNNQPADSILKLQSEQITELWNAGIIENVYFDIEGIQKANDKSDFVFFVNANTTEEAKSICNALPFHQENIATYDIYQAGVFWMGKHEKN